MDNSNTSVCWVFVDPGYHQFERTGRVSNSKPLNGVFVIYAGDKAG